ncbi:hypothetical protein IW262DRAFT_1454699 [Armillaria fumosa]|nr:hypothetical protein IW262DRAFT_1454699 [Armillaria fumosa]
MDLVLYILELAFVAGATANCAEEARRFYPYPPASGEFGSNIKASLLLQASVKPKVKLPEGEFAAVVISSSTTKLYFNGE